MQIIIIQIIYHSFMTYLIAKFNIYLGLAYILYQTNRFFVEIETARMKEKILNEYLSEMKKRGKNEDN